MIHQGSPEHLQRLLVFTAVDFDYAEKDFHGQLTSGSASRKLLSALPAMLPLQILKSLISFAFGAPPISADVFAPAPFLEGVLKPSSVL